MARTGKDDRQEAVVVDQLLRKLRPFDRTYVAEREHASGARPFSHVRSRPPLRPAGVWARVMLGVLLGVALTQWPYAHACEKPLILYMVAVTTVLVAGLWGARASWRSRMGFAHIIALGTILWGISLSAQEVLPRVGYAKTRMTWRCVEKHARADSIRPEAPTVAPFVLSQVR
ncbi:MAG: hypothetical protein DME05_12490 [Candidatus Rokuibacteriota bacterium]|nr:MAG: hypothetical protein DME05_12490 [Candidatus Rokubacteria bacterium]PYN73342.1 MAG: hypothetical protein DMD97_21085 [Candidatus Rokubacteria bacterium]